MLSLTTPTKRHSTTHSRSYSKRQRIAKLPTFIFNTIFRKQNNKPAPTPSLPPPDEMNIFGGYVEHTYTNTGHATNKFASLNISAIAIDEDELPLAEIMDEDVPMDLSPHVELPVDIWMLIVEEVTNPVVLASLARTSRLLWALATPQLYRSIGIGMYEHGVGVYPARGAVSRPCTGHQFGTMEPEFMEYTPALTTEAVLNGLSKRNGNSQYVRTVHFKDLRFTETPSCSLYALLPEVLKTMKKLERIKWVSELQPRAGAKPIGLPRHMGHIVSNLSHFAPGIQEWHVEHSPHLLSLRGGHVQQHLDYFPPGLRVLDIQQCKDVALLGNISKYLHGDAGRDVEELIVGHVPTISPGSRKKALHVTFNTFRPENPQGLAGSSKGLLDGRPDKRPANSGNSEPVNDPQGHETEIEPRKLTLKKLDLRNYMYYSNAPACLDLIDRDSLRDLRISGNNHKECNPQHFLNAEFTHPETGVPRNLHTLHLGCNYPGLAGPFFQSLPPLTEFTITIHAEEEIEYSHPLRTFILSTGPSLRRLGIQFERNEGERDIEPNGFHKITDEERAKPLLIDDEDTFLQSIAPGCVNLTELSICSSRNFLGSDFSRVSYLTSLFPSLNALAVGTRGDRNEWSQATTDGGPPAAQCVVWARTLMDSFFAANGRTPTLVRVNDHVYRVLPKSYIFSEGDFRLRSVSYSEHCALVEVARWDLHESEVPAMFRLMEEEAEMDKWAMGCTDEIDCY
ncbi:hypothetical protein BJ508DRAFT_304034 [Ascobolus immersus RN42]|uniref:F-box domain-containing protein n=1 Tax=Ascobolus immersus RN42 TaxID=1160509 RepID=A0A3N4IRK1_ASCIM|nr:hypothetical protein BJ508DRAFT_304034 [Ascobolus immersus RN42]